MLVVAGLLVGLAGSARAQSTATLQGTVTDPSGNSVPGSQVKATSTRFPTGDFGSSRQSDSGATPDAGRPAVSEAAERSFNSGDAG